MNQQERKFVQSVWNHYTKHGRHALLWRKTHNPYKILVSEIMLQQTQVDRVLPKYKDFLKLFPTVASLSRASLKDVLSAWQGLGYNRRAKMLHACTQEIIKMHKGVFPRTKESLEKLPGIGPYTAGAVCAFAFNQPVIFIETNIRSVYLHHFFNDTLEVSDAEILRFVERTLDRNNPREWYWALMDYGSFIKKEHGNPNTKSKHYAKQSTFKNSDRHVRGSIIRLLVAGKRTRAALHRELSAFEDIRVDAQLENLSKEGLVTKAGMHYILP